MHENTTRRIAHTSWGSAFRSGGVQQQAGTVGIGVCCSSVSLLDGRMPKRRLWGASSLHLPSFLLCVSRWLHPPSWWGIPWRAVCLWSKGTLCDWWFWELVAVGAVGHPVLAAVSVLAAPRGTHLCCNPSVLWRCSGRRRSSGFLLSNSRNERL